MGGNDQVIRMWIFDSVPSHNNKKKKKEISDHLYTSIKMNDQSHMAVIPFTHRLNLKDHIDDVFILYFKAKIKPTQNWSYEINRNKWKKKNPLEFPFLRPNRWRIWHMPFWMVEQCRLLRLFLKLKKRLKSKWNFKF